MQILTNHCLCMYGVIYTDYISKKNSVVDVSSDDYNEQKRKI